MEEYFLIITATMMIGWISYKISFDDIRQFPSNYKNFLLSSFLRFIRKTVNLIVWKKKKLTVKGCVTQSRETVPTLFVTVNLNI